MDNPAQQHGHLPAIQYRGLFYTIPIMVRQQKVPVLSGRRGENPQGCQIVCGDIPPKRKHQSAYYPVCSLNVICDALLIIRSEMLRLAALLLEFELIMSMQGTGEITDLQLMAEMEAVRRFTHKGALVAFADMNASPSQSGPFDFKSCRISKRGFPHLRRTLYQIMSVLLQHTNPDNSVFQFMDKK